MKAGMDFKRPTGFLNSKPRNWIDKTLPACPLCKSHALWEVATEAKLGLNRYHFRCPNCLTVLSIQVGAVVALIWAGSRNFRIEDVGSNSGMNSIVGKEYSVETLQGWANQPKGTPI